jgi:hypothetical protein
MRKSKAFLVFSLLVLLAIVTEGKRFRGDARFTKHRVSAEQQLIERDQRILATAFDDARLQALVGDLVETCRPFVADSIGLNQHCFSTLDLLIHFFGLEKHRITTDSAGTEREAEIRAKGITGQQISDSMGSGPTFGMCYSQSSRPGVGEDHGFGLFHTTTGGYWIVDSWVRKLDFRMERIPNFPDMTQETVSFESVNGHPVNLVTANTYCIVADITPEVEAAAAQNLVLVHTDPNPHLMSKSSCNLEANKIAQKACINPQTPEKASCCPIS